MLPLPKPKLSRKFRIIKFGNHLKTASKATHSLIVRRKDKISKLNFKEIQNKNLFYADLATVESFDKIEIIPNFVNCVYIR